MPSSSSGHGREFVQRIRLGRVIRIRRQMQEDETLWNHPVEPFAARRSAYSAPTAQCRKNVIPGMHRKRSVSVKARAGPICESEFGCKVSVITSINRAPGGHFVPHVGACTVAL